MAAAGALPTQPRNNHCDDSEPGRRTSTAADALTTHIFVCPHHFLSSALCYDVPDRLKLTNIMPASTTTTAAGSPSTRPQAACTAIHGNDGGHAPHAAASGPELPLPPPLPPPPSNRPSLNYTNNDNGGSGQSTHAALRRRLLPSLCQRRRP
ncbi:hypothetical protein EDB85DRAFT_2148011 [Lactarius pseudohatsudake]|nr:hypothetical protein EDB85DRAFT_2148011 [Lactarius pseudohatsudake]